MAPFDGGILPFMFGCLAMLTASEAAPIQWHEVPTTGSAKAWVTSSTAAACGGHQAPAVTIAVLEQSHMALSNASVEQHPPQLSGPTDPRLCPPDTPINTYGLADVENTWSYRRAYVSCNCNVKCSTSRFKPVTDKGSKLPERTCSVTSAVHSWWLGNSPGGFYAMRLPLPDCAHANFSTVTSNGACSTHVMMFAGMENCSEQIELIGTDKDAPVSHSCVFQKSIKQVEAFATFDLPKNWPTYSQEQNALDEAITTAKGCNYADQHLGTWAADGSVWKAPGCKVGAGKPPSKSNSMNSYVCTIGDSHFMRTHSLAKNVGAQEFGFKVKNDADGRVNQFLDNTTEREKVVVKAMKRCATAQKKLKGAHDATIIGMGSHWPHASPRDLEAFGDRLAAHAIKDDSCVIAVSTLDSCFESIPTKFPVAQRVDRSSWRFATHVSPTLWLSVHVYCASDTHYMLERVKKTTSHWCHSSSQAETLRRHFAKLRTNHTGSKAPRLFFVDAFSAALALHWTHCNDGDPVHFHASPMYKEMWRIILRAVTDLC